MCRLSGGVAFAGCWGPAQAGPRAAHESGSIRGRMSQGDPGCGSPWGVPQVECWSLRREPQPHRRSTGHALPSAAAQEHVPAKGCHPACVQVVPRGISWSPVPSARARSELGLSPLSLASIVTLSGRHVFPGEIVAMSGLGSALAVAMMVSGRGDPTLAALRSTDWMRAPGRAPAQSVGYHFSRRGVHALS